MGWWLGWWLLGEVLFEGLLKVKDSLRVDFNLVGSLEDRSVERLMGFRCLGY